MTNMERFIKTDVSTLPEMAALTRVHPSASTILQTLMTIIAEGKNNYGAVVVPNKVLQEMTNYSNKTVSDGTKVLAEHGFIGIAKVGRNNAYILNPDVLSMEAGKHLTYTHIDNIKILLTDRESEVFKACIKKMQTAKGIRQIKHSKALNNSSAIKTGRISKDKDLIDKETGEVIR